MKEFKTRKDKIDFLKSLAKGTTQISELLPPELWIIDDRKSRHDDFWEKGMAVRVTEGLERMTLTNEELQKRKTNKKVIRIVHKPWPIEVQLRAEYMELRKKELYGESETGIDWQLIRQGEGEYVQRRLADIKATQ